MRVLNNVLTRILSYFPTRLPMGMTEFNKWAKSIISIGNFPTNSVDDVRYVLAYLILQFNTTTAYKSKRYFILAVKAGAAKQIAGAVFQDIKQKQQERAKAELDAAREATKGVTTTTGDSNGMVQTAETKKTAS